MTIDKSCFVNPEDIRAVRIQCVKCGAANMVPIGKLGNIGLVITVPCVHCGEPSGIKVGTKECEEIIVFSDILGRLAEALKGRRITYSLQIECPE
jgi:hypothetical protein